MSLAHYKRSQWKFPSVIEKLTLMHHPQIKKKLYIYINKQCCFKRGMYCMYLFTLSLKTSKRVLQRPDEEAVVDQGGTSSVMNIHYEKEELEG